MRHFRGSEHVFKLQIPGTKNLNLEKRFDIKHKPGHTDTTIYDPGVIAEARDFFSALQPTCRARILGREEPAAERETMVGKIASLIQREDPKALP
jgi:hypothetical protein